MLIQRTQVKSQKRDQAILHETMLHFKIQCSESNPGERERRDCNREEIPKKDADNVNNDAGVNLTS